MSQIDRNGKGGKNHTTSSTQLKIYIYMYIFNSNVHLNFSVLHWEQAKLQREVNSTLILKTHTHTPFISSNKS